MKNLFKTMAIVAALTAACTSAKAQLYLSGSMSMLNSSGETERVDPNQNQTYEKDHGNTFNIGTEIGYYFNENMAFGADVSLSHNKNKNGNDKNIWTANNKFYFNPFFRYDFITNDKISLGAKTEAILGFGKTKNHDSDLYKDNEFGVSITPVFNYKFTPHWSAGVEFGKLSYTHRNIKNEDNGAVNYTKTDITNTWLCNLTLKSLTFSVVYTF